MGFPRQDDNISRALAFIDDKISYIAKAFQVDDLCTEQPGVKVRAANDTYELVGRLVTGNGLHRRERSGSRQIHELGS